MKKENGITLVALVISIIVLLILATVSIQVLTGDNGLLQKATTAKKANEEAKELELIKLAVSAAQVAGEGSITKENLENELKINFNEDKEIFETNEFFYYEGYRIYEDGKVEEGRLLPDEYQQVEYLESTGTQYIDTKVIPNDNTSVELDIMPLDANNGAFFGCIEIDQKKTWRFFNSGNRIYFDLNDRIKGSSMPSNIRTNIKLHNYYVIKDGIEVLRSNLKQDLNLISSLYIFAANQSNSPYEGLCSGKARIYACKIYNSDLIVGNYIPCYKKISNSNTLKGMYDIVTGKFYNNENTNGNDFIAGPEV